MEPCPATDDRIVVANSAGVMSLGAVDTARPLLAFAERLPESSNAETWPLVRTATAHCTNDIVIVIAPGQ